ncbi:hypothetical protein [Plantactinospora sp. CA-290183]|uniref:hypothetical protein n=1 Tax=Plantactinospora sp. CA-290183 TaxID=3240006 RepID=UPI003D8B7E8B
MAIDRSREELGRTRWVDAAAVVNMALSAALDLALGGRLRLFAVPKIAVQTVQTFKKAGSPSRRCGACDQSVSRPGFLAGQMSGAQVETIKMLVFATIVRRRLNLEQLDTFIEEVERSARDAGYEPTAA